MGEKNLAIVGAGSWWTSSGYAILSHNGLYVTYIWKKIVEVVVVLKVLKPRGILDLDAGPTFLCM